MTTTTYDKASAPAVPQWKINDAKAADSAAAIRANTNIGKLFQQTTRAPWTLANFASSIAAYHLVAELPEDAEVKRMNDDFLKGLRSFRKALDIFERKSGDAFPEVLQSLYLTESYERKKRNQQWEPVSGDFLFARHVRLTDLLDGMESSVEAGAISPESYRDSRMSTPTGRMAMKDGSSRAIRFVVFELLRHEIEPGARFNELAQECIQILTGDQVGTDDIRARVKDAVTA